MANANPEISGTKSNVEGNHVNRLRTESENSFADRLFNHPDSARQYASSSMDCFEDVIQILLAWGQTERNYGTSMDKIIVCANQLNSLRGSKGIVNALAALVGSFQSAGKHHLGLHVAIENEVNSILRPALKVQRDKVDKSLNCQLAIQKEVTKLRESLKKLKDDGDSSKQKEMSAKYEKKTMEQSEALGVYLKQMYRISYSRLGQLNMSYMRITQSNLHVLNFNDEIARALKDIVSAVDADKDLAADLASLVNIEQNTLDGTAGGDLAGKIYEALGGVEPDVASASVDAVGELCSNAITISHVALRITESITSAVEARAKATAQVASGASLSLMYLREIAVQDDELLSEEMYLDSERNAWRVFMVSMKQSALVLQEWATELKTLSSEIEGLISTSESAQKQVLAARAAANKELQICAQSLKNARSNLDTIEDSIFRAEESRTRATSDISDLKDKIETKRRKSNITDPPVDTVEQEGNVVQRLLGLSVQSPQEVLAEAEKKAEKADLKLSDEREERKGLLKECLDCSERLETQIGAYAVQMAGTVSGFVASHASAMSKLRRCLCQLVDSTGNTVSVIRQLEEKMLRELGKIDPLKDMDRFASKDPVSRTLPLIQVPISFKSQQQQLLQRASSSVTPDDDEPEVPTVLQSKCEPESTLTKEFKLPAGQEVIASFSCAYLPGKVPQQGYLTLTSRFMCFRTLPIYEPMFGSCNIVVKLSDINKVTKARGAWGLVANSLRVQLYPLNEGSSPLTLEFTSLFYRDKCHDQLMQLSTINKSMICPPDVTNSWSTLDPRLGDNYKGNNLVVEGNSKKSRSTFLKLGHSTADLEKLSNELEQGHPVFEQSCPSCSEPFNPLKPCDCWVPACEVPVLHKSYTAISESFWQSTTEGTLGSLFLGIKQSEITLDDTNSIQHRQFDIAKELCEQTGDYEPEFPEFKYASDGEKDFTKFERTGYTGFQTTYDDCESENDPMLYRVVSFAHPIPNTLLGKQIAKTTQLQTVRGVRAEEGQIGAKSVIVVNNDTALCGFPYSDSFIVRTRNILTPLKHSTGGNKGWCRLQVYVRIIWLKSVSVPFLKGKIEKENIATGKTTMEGWIRIARVHVIHSPVVEIPAAEPKQEDLIVAFENSSDLMDLEFYIQAWRQSTPPQKLQEFMLFIVIVLQLFTIFFK